MIDHIDQLTSIFTDYEDVIDVVQAGFIGVWGGLRCYFFSYYSATQSTFPVSLNKTTLFCRDYNGMMSNVIDVSSHFI